MSIVAILCCWYMTCICTIKTVMVDNVTIEGLMLSTFVWIVLVTGVMLWA